MLKRINALLWQQLISGTHEGAGSLTVFYELGTKVFVKLSIKVFLIVK